MLYRISLISIVSILLLPTLASTKVEPPQNILDWVKKVVSTNRYNESIKPEVFIAGQTIRTASVKWVETADYHPTMNFRTNTWVNIPGVQGQFRVWVLYHNLGDGLFKNQLALMHINCLSNKDEVLPVEGYYITFTEGEVQAEWSSMAKNGLGRIMLSRKGGAELYNELQKQVAESVCIKEYYIPQ